MCISLGYILTANNTLHFLQNNSVGGNFRFFIKDY